MLKNGPDPSTVCASVVWDSSKYMDSTEDLLKLLQGGETSKILLPTIPKVKSFSEVHDFGTLCRIKYKENLGATPLNSTYTMMVIPYQRAKIAEHVMEPNPFGIVKVWEIEDKTLREQDLDMEQSVLFKFMKLSYTRCFELAKDERFKQYLKYLE